MNSIKNIFTPESKVKKPTRKSRHVRKDLCSPFIFALIVAALLFPRVMVGQDEKSDERTLADAEAAMLEKLSARSRVAERKNMDRRMLDMINLLGENEAREQKLEALAQKALDAYEKDWIQAGRESLENLSNDERILRVSKSSLYFKKAEMILPQNQQVWKDGLKTMFTKEELVLCENADGLLEKRRIENFGNIILIKIEQIVGLSEKQRENLLPVVSKFGNEQYLKNFQGKEVSFNTLSVTRLFRDDVGRKILSPHLNESQIQRWSSWADYVNRKYDEPIVTTRTSGTPEPDTDEEYVEKAIGLYLQGMKRFLLDGYVNYQLAQVEALDRLVKLDNKQKRLLILAAKGNSQDNADSEVFAEARSFYRDYNNYPRESIYSALSKETIRYVGRDKPFQSEFWIDTVERTLTPEQKSVRDEYVLTQKEIERQVTVQQVVTNGGMALRFTPDQIDFLEPRLRAALEKYEVEIYKSHPSSVPWFFNPTRSMLLLCALPEDEFEGVLTKKQIDLWRKSFKPTPVKFWDQVLEAR